MNESVANISYRFFLSLIADQHGPTRRQVFCNNVIYGAGVKVIAKHLFNPLLQLRVFSVALTV